jgi:hypothetical protein
MNTAGTTKNYRKRFLHGNEANYFSPCIVHDVTACQIGGEQVAMAICADITYRQHAEEVAFEKPDLYIASICFYENGIAEA